jgi:hypothetical protein
MSPESRAILESTVTAARLGDGWHLDLGSFNPRGRRALALVAGLRGRDATTGQAITGTLTELAAGEEGEGFLEQLGKSLWSGDVRARRALGTRLGRDDRFRQTVYELAEGTRLSDARRTQAAEKHLDEIVRGQAASVFGVHGGEIARDLAQRIEKSAGELSHMSEAERRELLNTRGGDDAHRRILAKHWELIANINEDLLTKRGGTPHGRGHPGAHASARQPATAENPVGFGAQESAMQHIERSLRATRSALEKLNQRIPGGAAVPPAQHPPKLGS